MLPVNLRKIKINVGEFTFETKGGLPIRPWAMRLELLSRVENVYNPALYRAMAVPFIVGNSDNDV